MTFAEAKGLCVNPGAISPGDRYMVMDSVTRVPLESHSTKEAAQYFCDVMNEHEVRNQRRPVYVVEAFT